MKVTITASLPLELVLEIGEEVVQTSKNRSKIIEEGVKLYFKNKYEEDEDEL